MLNNFAKILQWFIIAIALVLITFVGITDEEEKAELVVEANPEFHETENSPNLEFEQQLKQLETFIPELSGISSTWATKEKSTLFAEVTVAIARHHKSNDKQIARLQTATQRLIDAAPEDILYVGMDMHFFTKFLVPRVLGIYEDLSMFEQDSAEILELKEQLVDLYPATDVSFTDDFLRCVESLKTKANKEVTKLFGSLANKMDRAAKSIEKMQRKDRDVTREILFTTTRVFSSDIVRIIDLHDRVFARDCYAKIDFDLLEQIGSDLGQISP